MLKVELTGFSELSAKLMELTNDLAEQALISGTSAAASVVRKRVLENARALFVPRTGTLNRAIYQKRLKRDADGKFKQTYIVGVLQGKRYQRIGKRQISKDAFYWWWLEFGTAKMRAHPFVRTALPAVYQQAVDAMKARLSKQITAKAAQLAARK